MTKGNPHWERFEHEVQRLLDLRSTPGSGNQWHDPSDGRTRPGNPYKLMVDCKFTENKSYSLNGKMLQAWWDKSTELGYHFALPVRLGGSEGRIKEWVTVPLDDYAELVDAIKILNGPDRCGALSFDTRDRVPCCRRRGHFDRHDNGFAEWTA